MNISCFEILLHDFSLSKVLCMCYGSMQRCPNFDFDGTLSCLLKRRKCLRCTKSLQSQISWILLLAIYWPHKLDIVLKLIGSDYLSYLLLSQTLVNKISNYKIYFIQSYFIMCDLLCGYILLAICAFVFVISNVNEHAGNISENVVFFMSVQK